MLKNYSFIIVIYLLVSSILMSTDYSKYPILDWKDSAPPPNYLDYIRYYGNYPFKYEFKGEYSTSENPLAPKILLIVNSSLYPKILAKITSYKDDILNLGFRVSVFTISGGNENDLKNLIKSNL